jgi:hypothetical protein
MAEAITSRLMELETDIRYQEYATGTEPEYQYTAGTRPILISAPHGAAHTRDGSSKDEDEYTAGMARLLGERTNAHILYARRKSATDPNAYPCAPYKKYLQEIISKNQIRFVIDLHGAKDSTGNPGDRSVIYLMIWRSGLYSNPEPYDSLVYFASGLI